MCARKSSSSLYQQGLDGFWIGRTEVTNAQYRPFVEAGGYQQRELWTQAGWAWREENNVIQSGCWDDEQWWWSPPDSCWFLISEAGCLGVAIAKMSYEDLAGRQPLSMGDALRYAANRLAGLMFAPLLR